MIILALQGNLIANQLNAHFAATNLNQFQPGLYQSFFQVEYLLKPVV
jgi:hypothetical protein